MRNPPKNFKHECQPNRCVCKKGLYLNEYNECVIRERCKKMNEPKDFIRCTGENEVVIGCYDESKARVCPCGNSTKRNVFPKKYKSRNQCILNKCDCVDDFLRNICGKCIPEKKCHEKCTVNINDPCSGPNEVRVKFYQECKARKCSNLNSMKCTGEAAKIQRNVCECDNGYWRDGCDQCVPESQCSIPCKCTNPCVDPNEEWQFGNKCMERTCQNMWELPRKLCLAKGYYKCDCSGVRDLWRDGNKCVPRDQCPPEKNNDQV